MEGRSESVLLHFKRPSHILWTMMNLIFREGRPCGGSVAVVSVVESRMFQPGLGGVHNKIILRDLPFKSYGFFILSQLM